MYDASVKTLPKALQESLSCAGQPVWLDPLYHNVDEHAHFHHPIIAALTHPMTCVVVCYAFSDAPLGDEPTITDTGNRFVMSV